MSHYPKGLRFDIYERFTLSEDAPGISELEDIELLPRITMQTRDDQAVLSGDLLLTGTYVGTEESSAVKELNHRIPVEITLPLKRIHRMDNIGIEIENFDVELLSARSLNITGVISLNGIAAPAEQTWNAQGEAVFEHEASPSTASQADANVEAMEQDVAAVAVSSRQAKGSDVGGLQEPKRTNVAMPYRSQSVTPQARQYASNEPNSRQGAQQQAVQREDEMRNAAPAEQVQEARREQERQAADELTAELHSEPVTPASAQSSTQAERQANEGQAEGREERNEREEPDEREERDEQYSEPPISAEPVDLQAVEGGVAATEERTAEQQEEEQAAPADERTDDSQAEAEQAKELKIAFASKNTDSSEWSSQAEGVKSLLNKQTQDEARVTDAAEEQASDAHEEEERTLEDSVKWKNLLLSAEQEEQRFSKMKMCIVQKEETLESIASRYAINPKEIVLYNRLDSDQVEEGQVIYIPSE